MVTGTTEIIRPVNAIDCRQVSGVCHHEADSQSLQRGSQWGTTTAENGNSRRNANTRQVMLTARLGAAAGGFVWAKGGRAGMPGLHFG